MFLVVTSVSAASEDELQQQKTNASQQKETAQYQLDMTQNTVDGLVKEITKANDQISVLNNQVKETNEKMETLNQQIQNQQDELTKVESQKSEQEADLEERLRVMYMYGSEGYSEVLFSSESFADFISRVEMVASIAKADQDALNQLENIENEINQKKTNLENSKTELESVQAEQQAAVASQENIVSQQNELLAKNKDIAGDYQAEISKQESSIKEAETGLAAIAKQKAEEAAKQKAESDAAQNQSDSTVSKTTEDTAESNVSTSTGTTSSEGFIWPVDCSYITSYFGYRGSDATGGVGTAYHEGLDIGETTGQPIYAIASGTVTLAQEYGGYGNCVMIAHDNGFSSLYGHQSEIAVSEGQYVNQGDIIGYVGSTGWSTGPHLHISILDGAGNYLDPSSYLPMP